MYRFAVFFFFFSFLLFFPHFPPRSVSFSYKLHTINSLFFLAGNLYFKSSYITINSLSFSMYMQNFDQNKRSAAWKKIKNIRDINSKLRVYIYIGRHEEKKLKKKRTTFFYYEFNGLNTRTRSHTCKHTHTVCLNWIYIILYCNFFFMKCKLKTTILNKYRAPI
jgi:hypothetical protein